MARIGFAIFILLQLSGLHLWGLDSNKRLTQYMLDQWDSSNGLHSNTINSITQTPDGYLWFATSKGLVRFDGIKFSKIPFIGKGKTDTPGTSEPRALLTDREGSLWIGSTAGLTRFHRGQFKTYTRNSNPCLSAGSIRRMSLDRHGNLWLSFMAGYIDRLSQEKITPFNNVNGLTGGKINAVVENQDGDLFFATRENGIFFFKEGFFYPYLIPDLGDSLIITLYFDHKDNLWIGTTKGLLCFNGKSTVKFGVNHGLSNEYVSAIFEDSEGTLWIGTLKGLNRLKRMNDGTISFRSILTSCVIFCIYEDYEKSLWIGTDNSGLKRLRDRIFNAYKTPKMLQGETILSIAHDRRGNTLIGTLSGKLFCIGGSGKVESTRLPGLSLTGISAISFDRKGDFQLGTVGKGVIRKKQETFIQVTELDGLTDDLVISIFNDSRGDIWICTLSGVSIFRSYPEEIVTFTHAEGLSGNAAYNVCEDKAGNIWIAADQGITVLKGGRTERQYINYYLDTIPTVYIHEDISPPKEENSIFWITTKGAGLIRLRLKDGKHYSYTNKHGLLSNVLYQLFEYEGWFWLTSNIGILRVNKKELNSLSQKNADEINCTLFGRSDGMQSSEFHNELSRHSRLKTDKGEYWFVTKMGISIMDPKRIRLNKTPPPVIIERISFKKQSILMPRKTDPYAFKGTGDFSVGFTAPTFLSPEKVSFKYTLEGFETEWNTLPPGKDRAVHYRGLEPGTYAFRVIARNADGVWNKTGASVIFTIQPSFYQTFLFKIVVLFLGLSISIIFLYMYRKRSSEKNRKYKNSRLNSQYARECIKKLKHLMESAKIYRDTEISLQLLAKKISIKPYLLSQIINEHLNRNFYDFVNYYRIEEAKQILVRPDRSKLNIDLLAGDVGFKTKAAFYNAFKKLTGKTPMQYKKQMENKS